MMTGTTLGRSPEPVRAGKSTGEAAVGTTYYIDSVAGRNSNRGTSVDSAWQDFTNINGRTLGAGERLLIKRGSVINQELQLSAKGTADRWVEIGAYGDGPRPIIRRNWNIGDRCGLIKDPDYLRIRSLVVSYAGKGLVVYYATPGHQGLLIEDCIGHHIEGFYFGLVNSAGIQHRQPAIDFDLAQWDRIVSLMLTGVFELCQQAARVMVRVRGQTFAIVGSQDAYLLLLFNRNDSKYLTPRIDSYFFFCTIWHPMSRVKAGTASCSARPPCSTPSSRTTFP
jgi:hypothetical protein